MFLTLYYIFSVFGGTGTTFGATQNKPPAFGGSTFGNTTGGGGTFAKTIYRSVSSIIHNEIRSFR